MNAPPLFQLARQLYRYNPLSAPTVQLMAKNRGDLEKLVHARADFCCLSRDIPLDEPGIPTVPWQESEFQRRAVRLQERYLEIVRVSTSPTDEKTSGEIEQVSAEALVLNARQRHTGWPSPVSEHVKWESDPINLNEITAKLLSGYLVPVYARDQSWPLTAAALFYGFVVTWDSRKRTDAEGYADGASATWNHSMKNDPDFPQDSPDRIASVIVQGIFLEMNADIHYLIWADGIERMSRDTVMREYETAATVFDQADKLLRKISAHWPDTSRPWAGLFPGGLSQTLWTPSHGWERVCGKAIELMGMSQ